MRLPQIDGVAPSRVRLPDGIQDTIGPEVWRQRLETGKVLNQDAQPLHWDSPCRGADLVFYYREPPPETEVPFEEEILYQDDHLLIADKPHFLPVIPSGRFLRETLLIRLRRRTGIDDLTPVHRLDRDTAGLVIFSVNEATRGLYTTLFQQRSITKIYHALAPWRSELQEPLTHHSLMVESLPFFRMKEVPGEANSSTRVTMLERRSEVALYQLEPVSGRKHQLRLHMASLGAGILNDPYYPEMRPDVAHDDFSSPLQLLAYSLAFTDPVSGQHRRFTSHRRL
jgi:tRNA pseudouridine32 synthase / 23S rRNA pseudouridine746 synthase